MEKLKLYTVTKTSSDETLQIGDIIWLSEEEWNIEGTNDFEVEECTTHHLFVLGDMEIIVKNES